jgi:DNA-binding Lrp family transcriptional regulator
VGRPKKVVNESELFDFLMSGVAQKDIAEEFEISVPTLARRIARIQEEQGILMQYRTLQSLELTALQSRILEAITPEKITEAPLRDLVLAFKILKEKEHLIEGKPGEIKGLVSYLIAIEKEELALKKIPKEEIQDVDIELSEEDWSSPGSNDLPDL